MMKTLKKTATIGLGFLACVAALGCSSDSDGSIDDVSQPATGNGTAAAAISYSNTTSGLVARTVQAAIDEVNAKATDALNRPSLPGPTGPEGPAGPPGPMGGGFADQSDTTTVLSGQTVIAAGDLADPGSYVVMALATVRNPSTTGEHAAIRCSVRKIVGGVFVAVVESSETLDLDSGERATVSLQGSVTITDADDSPRLELACNSAFGSGEALKGRLAAIRFE